jgi:hypothetical protein
MTCIAPEPKSTVPNHPLCTVSMLFRSPCGATPNRQSNDRSRSFAFAFARAVARTSFQYILLATLGMNFICTP